MTDNTPKTPTDAEIVAFAVENGVRVRTGKGAIKLVRAALTRWGQPAHSVEPGAWKHDCAALLMNDVELWIDACPHCGKPRNAPQPSPAAQGDALERERICAAIKAEDDYCVEHGDYMLDSDDCIKIVRGEWTRPEFAADAARAAQEGKSHDN